MIGYAFCGSFCTLSDSLIQLKALQSKGYDILPIASRAVQTTDTRFWKSADFCKTIEEICTRPLIKTIEEAEPIGPSVNLEALIISPCTGNTLAKIANGITDSTVCMAAKAHLRNDRPLIIALATNDALSANLKSLAALIERKCVFFVPLRQDNPEKKPHSLVAAFDRLPDTLALALKGRQIQPLFV